MAQSPLDQLIDQREEALRRLADIDAKILALKETRRAELLAELATLGFETPSATKPRRARTSRTVSAEPMEQRIIAALAASEPQTAKQLANSVGLAGASNLSKYLRAMAGSGVLAVTAPAPAGKGKPAYQYRLK